MIHEFSFPSRELEILRNEDGTHKVRVVQIGGDPIEFSCTLEGTLQVTMGVDHHEDLVLMNDDGTPARVSAETELNLRVMGRMKADAKNHAWTMRVLNRDDCGRERA